MTNHLYLKISLLGLICLYSLHLNAQNAPGTELRIKKAKGTITLDGVLDEPDWLAADVADDWYQHLPSDSVRADPQTEVRVTFNDEFLYFSFLCYDDDSPDIINSLRRDFQYELNDNVGMAIGPYNDGLNGFFFVVTPAGVQMEGTVTNAGSGDDAFNVFWDNKWYSETVRYKDKWIVELAIPFKSLRYRSDIREWNISFDRWDLKRNQQTSWIRTPVQYVSASFAYGGKLIWEDPIPKAKMNISVIPYVAGSLSGDNETTPKTSSSDLQAGFDAKVSITPSLNLDLTVNPDFSQVEVDQQIINLTRFEFQFPERRQFFLENSDLIDLAGFPSARPFFSRRIGLVQDSTGLFQRIPIAYGARLSGSLSEKWRVGVMNMQTKKELSLGLPAQNYTVAALQRNFWKQSNFTVSLVNKQSLGVDENDQETFFHESIFREIQVNGTRRFKANTYNRVISADLEMLSADNKWYHSSFIGKSFDDFNNSENLSGLLFLRYATRNVSMHAGHSFVNEFFNAEAGFVPSARVYPGQINYFGSASYTFYPADSPILRMGPELMIQQTYLPGGPLTDRDYNLSYSFRFSDASAFQASYNYVYQRLTNDFNFIDPSQYTSFLAGETYDWHTVGVFYQSNTRKALNFNVRTVFGGFYNGRNFNLSGELKYRYQPYGNISLRFDFNDLNLPEEYGRERLFLIGPRIDLTFSDKVFLTTYIQYNNLLDNINLNARFQWRYQPASDIFIVYTENYLPQDLFSKNRALVFKTTYWLNL